MKTKPQSALVEHTLQQLLAPSFAPKVVSYLTYHFIGVDEALHTLQHMRKERIYNQLLVDERLFPYFSKKEIVKRTENDDWISVHALEKLGNLEHLFLPILPFSLSTSIVELNDRDPIVRFILQSLFSGVKVSALSIGMNPNHSSWKEKNLNKGTPALNKQLHFQLQKLKQFGIQFFEPQEAISFFSNKQKQKKKIFTAKDIDMLIRENKQELILDQQTILTPLAKDILKTRNIHLIRK